MGAITSILYIVIFLGFIFLYEARWTSVKTKPKRRKCKLFCKCAPTPWKLNPKDEDEDEDASYSVNLPPHHENLTQKTKTQAILQICPHTAKHIDWPVNSLSTYLWLAILTGLKMLNNVTNALSFVWIALKRGNVRIWHFFPRSCALFTGPASMEFNKFCFKTRSHSTIHTFKNYFVTVFSAINFQFSTISGIQTDPKANSEWGLHWSTLVRIWT